MRASVFGLTWDMLCGADYGFNGGIVSGAVFKRTGEFT
jgi:hypothetical protein